jgi:hypothetical protein
MSRSAGGSLLQEIEIRDRSIHFQREMDKRRRLSDELLGTLTTPDDRCSGLRAALDRHNLFGIEPVVDPVSPMLHQLRARANQRERSVLLVEPFHSRIIEMRELELDDIAILSIGVQIWL